MSSSHVLRSAGSDGLSLSAIAELGVLAPESLQLSEIRRICAVALRSLSVSAGHDCEALASADPGLTIATTGRCVETPPTASHLR